jgi:hypothetical protein
MPDIQYMHPKQWSNFMTQETISLILAWLEGSVNAQMVLFTAAPPPSPTVRLSDFTFASFAGYAPASVSGWSDVGLDANNQAYAFADTVTFQGSDTVNSQTVVAAGLIADNSGTQATAGSVVLTGTAITSIPVSGGGSGYEFPPAVTFTGGTGSGGAAHTVISGGAVTGIVVDAGGDYSVAPTAVIAKPQSLVEWGPLPSGVPMGLPSSLLPLVPQINLPATQAP